MKQAQTELEKIKREIIASHSNDDTRDCLVQDLDWLLSCREAEVKRELRKEINKKIWYVNENTGLECFKKIPVVNFDDILSLLAGKELNDINVPKSEEEVKREMIELYKPILKVTELLYTNQTLPPYLLKKAYKNMDLLAGKGES